MAQDIQRTERKKLSNKNTLPGKIIIWNRRREKKFFRQTKAKELVRINWDYKNVKGTFFSWKEVALTNNKRTYENRNLTRKSNYIVKSGLITN